MTRSFTPPLGTVSAGPSRSIQITSSCRRSSVFNLFKNGVSSYISLSGKLYIFVFVGGQQQPQKQKKTIPSGLGRVDASFESLWSKKSRSAYHRSYGDIGGGGAGVSTAKSAYRCC